MITFGGEGVTFSAGRFTLEGAGDPFLVRGGLL